MTPRTGPSPCERQTQLASGRAYCNKLSGWGVCRQPSSSGRFRRARGNSHTAAHGDSLDPDDAGSDAGLLDQSSRKLKTITGPAAVVANTASAVTSPAVADAAVRRARTGVAGGRGPSLATNRLRPDR